MMLPNGVTARLFICSMIACWLTFSVNSAANIEVSKFLEFGAIATDNPGLESGDTDAELVFNLAPAVELKFAGNRFGAIARGEIEYLRFTDAEDEIVNPNLSSKLTGTLIDNLLFLDASLVISKLSPDGNFLRLSDDDNTAAVFKVTTFLDRSFGRTADFYLAHTYSTLVDEESDSFESDQNFVEFSLERDPQYGGFLWGVGGSYSQDNSDFNEFQNSNVYAKIGATISQTFLTELTVGIERRDFEFEDTDNNPLIGDAENSLLTGDQDSKVWQLDFTWTPSEFTSLKAGYGERFFGNGPTLELKHRVRNSRIVASFTRDVTRETASLDGISTLSGTTSPTIGNTDSIELTNGDLANPLDEPFVDNSFRLAYKLAGRRSDFIIDAIYSDLERLDGEQSFETLLGRIVFDRRLSNFLSLRLQYDHQLSQSDDFPEQDYTENRFAVKFIYHFDGVSEFDDDDLDID